MAARLRRAAAVVALLLLATNSAAAGESGDAKTRQFRLQYGASVKELPPGAKVRVWIPIPQSNDHQNVSGFQSNLPAKGQIREEPKYGNKMLYFEAKPPESREISFDASWKIVRNEVLGLKKGADGEPQALSGREKELFLKANQKVPVGGKTLGLVKSLKLPSDPLEIGKLLYDRVEDHMKYDKSRPGYGNGDAEWACDSRFGNCTDFHSLFISLARAQKVPARFEIGFPLPPERGEGEIGGYHCWAFFHTEKQGWVPVDISEADKHPDMKRYYFGNLTENRVAFTTGRDIVLSPKQDGPALNFVIYPYVEVDGKEWPKDKLGMRIRFEDVKSR